MELLFTVGKMLLMTVVIIVPLLILLVRKWRHGSIMIPNSPILFTALLLPVAYAASLIFAANKNTALLGFNFNTDSLAIILLGFLALILTTLLCVNKALAHKVTRSIGYLASFVFVVFVVQLLLQAASVTSVPWVSFLQPVNSWLDVAALTGLLVLFLSLKNRAPKQDNETKGSIVKSSIVVIVLMLFLGIFTHVTLVFILLAAVAVFKTAAVAYSQGGVADLFKKGVVILPVIVFVMSAFFIVDSTLLNAKVSNTLQGWTNISFVNVRPNWQGTLDVAKGTVISADVTTKLFGPGAGSFSEQWRIHKPLAVNNTQFWSTNFTNAVGFVPTSIITGGAVSFAAWVLFLLALLQSIIRSRGSVLSLATLFIWVFAVLNPVGTLVLLIAFALVGALVAESARTRNSRMVTYKLSGEGTNKIVAFVVLPVLFVAGVGTFLTVVHRSLVNGYFVQASSAMIDGNMNKAEQHLNVIKRFADVALVEQGYTKVALARLSLVLQESTVKGSEVSQESLQAALSNVLSHAQKAIERDPKDPNNYIALGTISEQLITLQIGGSAESALAAYTQAAILDPRNPAIPLAIARVQSTEDNKEQVVLALETSLSLKNNYIPALYQYGVLKLSLGETQTAIQALGSVVQLNQNHANALYYLSLALLQEDRTEEAVLVMRRVAVLNPDNEQVQQIVVSLEQRLTQSQEGGQAQEGAASTTGTTSSKLLEKTE